MHISPAAIPTKPRKIDQAQVVWNRQMADLEAQLAPFVFQIDGDQYINHDAPADVSALYSRMTSVGYAKGWFA